MKKIASLLLALSVLLVGCNQAEQKSKTENVVNNKDEKKESNTTLNKKVVEDKKVKVEHNFEVAKNLVSDYYGYYLNNLDVLKDNSISYYPRGFITDYLFIGRFKNLGKKEINDVRLVGLENMVELINVFNKDTYDEKKVLDLLTDDFYNRKDIFYKEIDEKGFEKSEKELLEMINIPNMVVYFKQDKSYLYSIQTGLGGIGFPIPAEESKWVVLEDSLVIPMVSTDKKLDHTVTLKFNNKNYNATDKKSLYYVYDIKR